MLRKTMNSLNYTYLELIRRDMFIGINDKKMISALTDRLYATSHFCGCTGKCNCREELRKHIHKIYRPNRA